LWRPKLRLYWSKIRGTNNGIVLGKGARLTGYVEIRGANNRIIFGDGVRFSGKIFVKGNNQTFMIGAGSSLRRAFVVMQENCDITIGEQCLFSRDVEIRTSDAHSLIDAETGRRINPAASVTIGNHVWVGAHVFISKGAAIGSDNVVGAMSFVSGEFPETGVVIAGVPAKIIRRGVNWHVERRSRFAVGP
jgi:acetyltransferase-like isoleucine patch superfamily enzyme